MAAAWCSDVDAPETRYTTTVDGVHIAYQVAGDLVRAEECFERATDIRSDYAIAYRELGRVQEQQGKLSKALINLRTAGRLLPEDPTIDEDVARVLAATSRDTPPQEQHARSE